jgi:hypothetical protein
MCQSRSPQHSARRTAAAPQPIHNNYSRSPNAARARVRTDTCTSSAITAGSASDARHTMYAVTIFVSDAMAAGSRERPATTSAAPPPEQSATHLRAGHQWTRCAGNIDACAPFGRSEAWDGSRGRANAAQASHHDIIIIIISIISSSSSSSCATRRPRQATTVQAAHAARVRTAAR